MNIIHTLLMLTFLIPGVQPPLPTPVFNDRPQQIIDSPMLENTKAHDFESWASVSVTWKSVTLASLPKESQPCTVDQYGL
jgi:hypothetical protein